jgi:hypothetical protein
MSTKAKSISTILILGIIATAVFWWIHDEPRRDSLACLARLDTALHSGRRAELLRLLIMPAAVQSRTVPEQSEFLAKALNDEISPEGIAVLRQRGAYGPLQDLFPAEAEGWASQAGVRPDDCVAFKLERNGVRAEVVLLKPSKIEDQSLTGNSAFRIVRVNNVKQLAGPLTMSATENKP